MTMVTTAARRRRVGIFWPRGFWSADFWSGHFGRAALGLLFALACQAPAFAAGSLSIELNRVTMRDGRCVGSFLIGNDLGRTLDRFSIDLYVFDADGRAARRLLVDLAPLPAGRTTPASFGLALPCGGIGWLLIAD
ncbi:MAG TPA: hypothetical protein VE631_06965, partial [Alphaproteobacteria bacterium]|nr:hypothetical protein [Alphaproteobacteria bacterium]